MYVHVQRFVNDWTGTNKFIYRDVLSTLASAPSITSILVNDPQDDNGFLTFDISDFNPGTALRSLGFSSSINHGERFKFAAVLPRLTALTSLSIGAIERPDHTQLRALSSLVALSQLNLELIGLQPVLDPTGRAFHLRLGSQQTPFGDPITLPALKTVAITLMIDEPEQLGPEMLPIQLSILESFQLPALESLGIVLEVVDIFFDFNPPLLELANQDPRQGSVVRIDFRFLEALPTLVHLAAVAWNDLSDQMQLMFDFGASLERLPQLASFQTWGALYAFRSLPRRLLREAGNAPHGAFRASTQRSRREGEVGLEPNDLPAPSQVSFLQVGRLLRPRTCDRFGGGEVQPAGASAAARPEPSSTSRPLRPRFQPLEAFAGADSGPFDLMPLIYDSV